MNSIRWPRWLRPLCAWAALLLVAVLFIGGAQPVAVGLFTAPWDKLAHAFVFGVLAVLLGVALTDAHLLHGRRALLPPQALALAVVLAMLVAGADEFHQIWLPGREASWVDWLADVAGIALGLTGLELIGVRFQLIYKRIWTGTRCWRGWRRY